VISSSYDPRRWAATDLRPRPCNHWDKHKHISLHRNIYQIIIFVLPLLNIVFLQPCHQEICCFLECHQTCQLIFSFQPVLIHLLCCVHTNRRQTLSFVSSCIRIWVLGLNNTNCQYNVPWHKMHCTLHRMIFLQFVYCHVFIHNEGNINNRECATQNAHYCMVLLLQQYWLELANTCNSEFY